MLSTMEVRSANMLLSPSFMKARAESKTRLVLLAQFLFMSFLGLLQPQKTEDNVRYHGVVTVITVSLAYAGRIAMIKACPLSYCGVKEVVVTPVNKVCSDVSLFHLLTV